MNDGFEALQEGLKRCQLIKSVSLNEDKTLIRIRCEFDLDHSDVNERTLNYINETIKNVSKSFPEINIPFEIYPI